MTVGRTDPALERRNELTPMSIVVIKMEGPDSGFQICPVKCPPFGEVMGLDVDTLERRVISCLLSELENHLRLCENRHADFISSAVLTCGDCLQQY